MGKWLDNFKEKVSDWYNDSDQFYLRTIVDPFIELGKNIANSGQQISEYVTPLYSDIMAGANMLEGGAQDIQNGKYLSGAGKVVAAPLMAAASLVVPDGADMPIKATSKGAKTAAKVVGETTVDGVPNVILASSKPGTTLYSIEPKSRGLYKDIPTMEQVKHALFTHFKTHRTGTPVSKETVKKANWEATSAAATKHADQKAMNKAAAKSTGETRQNMTAKRAGHTPVQSVGKQVTQYDAERLTSSFTWQASPLGRTRADGVIQQNWNLFLENAKKLGFDTKSKDSVKELEKIFNTTYQHLFRKQGGILNYSIYFS